MNTAANQQAIAHTPVLFGRRPSDPSEAVTDPTPSLRPARAGDAALLITARGQESESCSRSRRPNRDPDVQRRPPAALLTRDKGTASGDRRPVTRKLPIKGFRKWPPMGVLVDHRGSGRPSHNRTRPGTPHFVRDGWPIRYLLPRTHISQTHISIVDPPHLPIVLTSSVGRGDLPGSDLEAGRVHETDPGVRRPNYSHMRRPTGTTLKVALLSEGEDYDAARGKHQCHARDETSRRAAAARSERASDVAHCSREAHLGHCRRI